MFWSNRGLCQAKLFGALIFLPKEDQALLPECGTFFLLYFFFFMQYLADVYMTILAKCMNRSHKVLLHQKFEAVSNVCLVSWKQLDLK